MLITNSIGTRRFASTRALNAFLDAYFESDVDITVTYLWGTGRWKAELSFPLGDEEGEEEDYESRYVECGIAATPNKAIETVVAAVRGLVSGHLE